MQKILEQNEPRSPSITSCDVQHVKAKKKCQDFKQRQGKVFRTMSGICNNKKKPWLGSKGTTLSRLLSPDVSRFQRSIHAYFDHDKPKTNGKLNFLLANRL